jgi:hypothetical protein
MAKDDMKKWLVIAVFGIAAVAAIGGAVTTALTGSVGWAIGALLIVLGLGIVAWNIQGREEEPLMMAMIVVFIIGATSWVSLTAVFSSGTDVIITMLRSFTGNLALAFFLPTLYLASKKIYNVSEK